MQINTNFPKTYKTRECNIHNQNKTKMQYTQNKKKAKSNYLNTIYQTNN